MGAPDGPSRDDDRGRGKRASLAELARIAVLRDPERAAPLTVRLMRFIVVGVAATVTHVAIALVCIDIFRFGVQLGTFTAFSVALCLSYLLHRSWTYESSGRHVRLFPRFATVACTGYALNASIMWLTVEVVKESYYIGLAVVVVVIPVFSFVIHSWWTFREEKMARVSNL